MFKIIFALFIVVPLLELYVLIQVGSGIGGLSTILLCLFTAALGGLLIRWQGLRTLLSAQHELRQGGLPTAHVLHGILLAIAGLLLFLPGLITDTLGFLLLVPWLRHQIISRAMREQKSNHPSYHSEVIEAEIIDPKDFHIKFFRGEIRLL
ncbi:MAG: FxsA family protein, partial [Mariprofundaceae bacterium]|nr:FxsA family protein [Mariprofundaceae bacterium]